MRKYMSRVVTYEKIQFDLMLYLYNIKRITSFIQQIVFEAFYYEYMNINI